MNQLARRVRSQVVCTDDFGNLVFRGHFTGDLVWAGDAVQAPSFYPGDTGGPFIDRAGFECARRIEHRLFVDSERKRNCNTCKYLMRTPHKRYSAGWLKGVCKAKYPKFKLWEDDLGFPHELPIRIDDNRGILFHPNDPMHMDCYKSRFDLNDKCQ